MAAITSDENDPQPLTSHVQGDGEETPAKQMRQARISPVHKQLAGAVAVLVVFIASLAIWGAGMEFPTTVSSSEVATTGAGSVTLTKTYRDVTSEAINDAVKWVTREGNWLFGGLKTAITYALLYIETVWNGCPGRQSSSALPCCPSPWDAGRSRCLHPWRCSSPASWAFGGTCWTPLR